MLHFPRWKIVLITLITLVGCLIALPNVLSDTAKQALPEWWARQSVVLGLDLQGGSYLLLEIDRADVIKNRQQTMLDEVRQSLRTQKIGYIGLAPILNGIQVRIRDAAEMERATTELKKLANPIVNAIGTTSGYDMNVVAGADGQIQLTMTEQGIKDRIIKALDQSIEIVRRRVDQLGTTEPIIQRQGADRILVQVPGLADPKRLKDLLGQTAKLTFRLVDINNSIEQAQQGRPPSDSELLLSNDPTPIPYLIEKRILVAGDDLVDAQAAFNPQTGEPVVNFRFNTAGAQRFARATTENVGKPFAIILDNKVISAPSIREPIIGGSGQISGRFTVEQAKDLSLLLRAGALPAKLTVVEERTVGPGLGKDSIEAGRNATLIGGALVVLFMVFVYGFFGWLANLAVTINVILIFSVLSMMGATLTLPGIAGILLTVGMAVDSNVLIYERIREEVRTGRSAISAIDTGFERALGTILDANVTTLIAAIVLFYIGTGPVKGFAVTLAVGILTTMFTAFTVTRLMVALWVKWRRPTMIKL
jgi:preprotein translocase subunit SecD